MVDAHLEISWPGETFSAQEVSLAQFISEERENDWLCDLALDLEVGDVLSFDPGPEGCEIEVRRLR